MINLEIKYSALLILLLLFGCADNLPTEPEGTLSSKIAFFSDRSGAAEIYTIDPETLEETQLTHNADIITNLPPLWSPDGSKILYLSDKNGIRDFFVINADGSNPVRINAEGTSENFPEWSPDGSKIVFQNSIDTMIIDIMLVNSDGSGLTNLTEPLYNLILRNRQPTWSPDGTKIAFASNHINIRGTHIYYFDLGITNIYRVTDFDIEAGDPKWSPDGSKILFHGKLNDLGNGDIYITNLDGSDLINLTKNFERNKLLQHFWFPDGTKIGFIVKKSINSNSYDLYTVNPNGTSVKFLSTVSLQLYRSVSFSPDGSQIAFLNYVEGNSEIFTMDTDGSDIKRLTNNFTLELSPSWSPFTKK